MIVYRAKKMFGGRVSIRDCVVKHAKRMKENIKLVYKDKYMIVKPKTKYVCDERLHRAERSDQYIKKGQYYKLYDYVFASYGSVKKDPVTTADGLKQNYQALGDALRQKGLIK